MLPDTTMPTGDRMEVRRGSIVFNERGYVVLELWASGPAGDHLAGFSLIGPMASESIIYATRLEALEALQDIEARSSGS